MLCLVGLIMLHHHSAKSLSLTVFTCLHVSVYLYLPVGLYLFILTSGWGRGFFLSLTSCLMSPGRLSPYRCPSAQTHLIATYFPRWIVCLHISLSPLSCLPVSLSPGSGLVACPPRDPGATVDTGRGVEGGAGHPAFKEEAQFLAAVDRASYPWWHAVFTSHVASGRKTQQWHKLEPNNNKIRQMFLMLLLTSPSGSRYCYYNKVKFWQKKFLSNRTY